MSNLLFHTTFTGTTTVDSRPGGTSGAGEEVQDSVGGLLYRNGSGLTSNGNFAIAMRPAYETTQNSLVQVRYTAGASPYTSTGGVIPAVRLVAQFNPIRQTGPMGLMSTNFAIACFAQQYSYAYGFTNYSFQNDYPGSDGTTKDVLLSLYVKYISPTRKTFLLTIADAAVPGTILSSSCIPEFSYDIGLDGTEKSFGPYGQVGLIIDSGNLVKEFWHYDLGSDALPSRPQGGFPSNLRYESGTKTSVSLSIGNTDYATQQTYSLYASTTAGFTPSTPTLLGTMTPGTNYVDSTATSAYKFYVAVANGTQTPQLCARAPDGDPICLGLIGESIGVIYPAGSSKNLLDWTAIHLGNMSGLRTVTTSNQGRSGTTTDNWLANSSAWVTSAITAMTTAGVKYCIIQFGINDAGSVSAATYAANILTIANAVVAAGMIAVINDTTCEQPPLAYATSPGVLIQYSAALDAICNATTIIRGIKDIFGATAEQSVLFGADPHLSTDGVDRMGALLAQRLMTLMQPGEYTDPGIANVLSGVSYEFAGQTLEGILTSRPGLPASLVIDLRKGQVIPGVIDIIDSITITMIKYPSDVVYYTIDGSSAVAVWNLKRVVYTAPITISRPCTLNFSTTSGTFGSIRLVRT